MNSATIFMRGIAAYSSPESAEHANGNQSPVLGGASWWLHARFCMM